MTLASKNRRTMWLGILGLSLSLGANGCMLEEEPGDAEDFAQQVERQQELRLVQAGDNECAYVGTVNCCLGETCNITHSYQHTEYVRASEFVGGVCPSSLDFSYENNDWSCQGTGAYEEPTPVADVPREESSF